MTEYFCNYEQDLALKELGFKEPCWCYFINDVFFDSMFPKEYDYFEHTNKKMEYTLAPLKSQVFKWFRDKYNLRGFIGFRPNVKQFDFHIYDMSLSGIDYVKQRSLEEYIKDLLVGTHEEAESACIDKLISVIKEKK